VVTDDDDDKLKKYQNDREARCSLELVETRGREDGDALDEYMNFLIYGETVTVKLSVSVCQLLS